MIKICISETSHALDPPSPCNKLSQLLGPLPTSSVTYFMDGPYLGLQNVATRGVPCKNLGWFGFKRF